MKNQYGLSRYIPEEIKREVRHNSKFGCVICRSGFIDYEHINPEFCEARAHDAKSICCLCPSCHGRVTRGQLSKNAVTEAYDNIRCSEQGEVAPPRGPLDFHTGDAVLEFGGLRYAPAVKRLLTYYEKDLIVVSPSDSADVPGTISAIFTDPTGQETLRLVKNEWIGSLEAWDIRVRGSSLEVRRKSRELVLRLVLEPPGKIVVDYLDMKFEAIHVLVQNGKYCVGRYLTNGGIFWVYVDLYINWSTGDGIMIEATDPHFLEMRDVEWNARGKSLATENRDFVMHSNAGVMFRGAGLTIGANTGSFDFMRAAGGLRSLNEVRTVLRDSPSDLPDFIGTVYNFDSARGVGVEGGDPGGYLGGVSLLKNFAKRSS